MRDLLFQLHLLPRLEVISGTRPHLRSALMTTREKR